MRKISYLAIFAAIAFSSCKEDFQKGEMGLEYKIIEKGSGAKVKLGDYMQIHLGQYYNNGKIDSLMSDTRNENGPAIEMLDSASTPPAYLKVLTQLRKGDSLVIRMLADSAFAKYPGGIPPMFKKGHYMMTTVKLLNIFSSREQADSAYKAEMQLSRQKDSISNIALLAKEDKELQAYFAKKNIKAVKAPMGTYVEIIKPGTGPNIDTSVVVKTNYTGRTMDGVMFDSNTDPSKGHVEPYNVNMTNDVTLGGAVIKGWTDGMPMLNKGAVAKFYIPSTLAYGKRGSGSDIKPNSILIFDIEVVDILNQEVARKENAERIRVMKENQKNYMDSVKASKPDTSAKK
jgi:FKBP-type peptidyl-prolyl cis-trans isomerase